MKIDRNHNPTIDQVLSYEDMSNLIAHITKLVARASKGLPRKSMYKAVIRDIEQSIANYGFLLHPTDKRHMDAIEFCVNAGASAYVTDYFSIDIHPDSSVEEKQQEYLDLNHLVPYDVSLKVLFFDGCLKQSIVLDIPAYSEQYWDTIEVDSYTAYDVVAHRVTGRWEVVVINRNVTRDHMEIISTQEL